MAVIILFISIPFFPPLHSIEMNLKATTHMNQQMLLKMEITIMV